MVHSQTTGETEANKGLVRLPMAGLLGWAAADHATSYTEPMWPTWMWRSCKRLRAEADTQAHACVCMCIYGAATLTCNKIKTSMWCGNANLQQNQGLRTETFRDGGEG